MTGQQHSASEDENTTQMTIATKIQTDIGVEPDDSPSVSLTDAETSDTEAIEQLRGSRVPDSATEGEHPPTAEHEHTTTNLIESSCDECESGNLQSSDERGEVICTNCGSVLEEEMFPQTANWKRQSAVDHIQTKSVTSNDDAGLSMGEASLGGTIDWKDMDGYGTPLSSKKRSRFHRLRSHDRRSAVEDPKESTYKHGLSEINRIAADVSLPRHVRDYAAGLFQDSIDDQLLSGNSIEAVSTALLHIACIEQDTTRSLGDLVEPSRADHLTVFALCSSLAEQLNCHDYGAPTEAYVSILADRTRIPDDDDARDIAHSILATVVTRDTVENSRVLQHTAAAIYSACLQTGMTRTIDEIATAAGIDTDALRQSYQQQLESVRFD